MSSTPKQGTHLFIDTNVLLNFFAYSKDDLDQLEKLINILKTKVVKLYLTRQVVNEFYRNRENKLAEAFDTFRPTTTPGCPRVMVGLPEYLAYEKALKEFKQSKAALTEAASTQAEARALLADQLFIRLLEETNVIEISSDAYEAANQRARLGNPPGKGGNTIGDELNWELLLQTLPEGSDLHVVTKDGDYASKFSPSSAKVFLQDEWKQRKQGTLHLHEQISQFFKNNYPNEDFSLEIEKRDSIDNLISSPNFAATHSAIASLLPYVPFLTAEEALEVVQGALSNNQVSWIADDSDVQEFLNQMLANHGHLLSSPLRTKLEEALGMESAPPVTEAPATEADGEELPF